jgi:hypothetical protein
MQNEENITPAQRELETALGSLRPIATSMDRDLLMFRAGRASGRRHYRIWQGGVAVLAVLLTVSLLHSPTVGPIERVQYVTDEQQAAPANMMTMTKAPTGPARTRSLMPGNYIRLRNRVLIGGLDELPEAQSSSGPSEPPMTRQQLLEMMLSS